MLLQLIDFFRTYVELLTLISDTALSLYFVILYKRKLFRYRVAYSTKI